MAALIPPSQSFSLLWLARDASRCHTGATTHTFCWPLWPLGGSCRSFIRPPSEIYVRVRGWGRRRRPGVTPAVGAVRARAGDRETQRRRHAASGIALPIHSSL